jgi:putative membrane protein
MVFMTTVLIGAVALLHIGFAVLEMLFWTRPLGLKVFRQSFEQAKKSQALAANQGLYNLFLAAGLLWSLWHAEPGFAEQLQIFFLSCVTLAGLYGAYTVNYRIFVVQALPALIGLGLVLRN